MSENAKSTKQKLLTFRGKPLVRSENTLYYGDMTDPYVVVLQVIDNRAFEDMQLPTKVSIQLLSTDESLPLLKRIKKNSEKNTLYDAINIASIWLERILEDGDEEDEKEKK